MAWIIGTQTEKIWKQTLQVSGYPRYLIEDGKAADKPVFVTNNLSAANSPPGEQVVFGRFSDCVVGLWGGVGFLSNPYVYADAGIIQCDINVLFSFTLLHATAFTISTDSGAQ